ncbi:HNH endonuclease [Sporosarcina sp. BP05]|uniref:HNH endonuclease n=1 Tax=Sporosarcina sp. BP05 TaxID=2758726 RepID=UPI0016459013|nr:HNH endonuclease [Sporosarcina sp. BP05]
MKWLISANGKMYNHVAAFDEFGYIDWRQTAKYQVGDIVYIYATKPYMKVMYKTVVEKVDLVFEKITDDKKYWINIEEYEKSISGKYARLRLVERVNTDKLALDRLKEYGLKAAPQGPIKVKEELGSYLEKNINDYYAEGIFPEEIDEGIIEGHKRTVSVNIYERSSVARNKSIEEHGHNCSVCDMNFEVIYGELGKGFIHVHHIVPLHEIEDTYKVNYKKDLVPVCPNCHAMLHRKINDESLSIAELKEVYRLKNT